MVIPQEKLEQMEELLTGLGKLQPVSYMVVTANNRPVLKTPLDCSYCMLIQKSRQGIRLCNRHYDELARKVNDEGTVVQCNCYAGMWTIGIPLTGSMQNFGVLIASQLKVGPYTAENENVVRRLYDDGIFDGRGLQTARNGTRPVDGGRCRDISDFLMQIKGLMVQSLIAGKELEDTMNELDNTYEELMLGYDISGKIGSIMEVETVLEETLKTAAGALDVKYGLTMFLDDGGKALEIRNGVNVDGRDLRRFWQTYTMDLIWGTVGKGRPLLINDLPARDKELARYPFRSILAVPLMQKNRPLGCLILANKRSGEDFTARDGKLASSIGVQASKSLENALLYGEIRSLLLDSVQALVSVIEARNPHSKGHSGRVADCALEIARRLPDVNLGATSIKLAAYLHDIGKIGVPAAILAKNRRFNPEEAAVYRKHCAIGHRIVGRIKQLEAILPGILGHHELFNGQGFPQGLRGKNIPLLARILCLADMYDVFLSMPRQQGMSRRDWDIAVVNRIRTGAGQEFDPELVNIFIQIKNEQLNKNE